MRIPLLHRFTSWFRDWRNRRVLRSSRRELNVAIDALRDALQKSRANRLTLLRDIVALDLASQIYSAARATRTLCTSETPEMAYPPSRHAFESVCDLLFLLKATPDPNYAAARAHVASFFSTQESLGLLATSGEAIGEPMERAMPNIKSLIEKDAHEIDGILPDQKYGDLLRKAVKDRSDGGEKHWSGLTRSTMIARIQKSTNAELGKMLRAYWAVMSQRSHPRTRLGERVHFTGRDIKIDLNPDWLDPGAIGVAEAAAQTAAIVLRDHGIAA